MTGSIWTRAALALLGVSARDGDDPLTAFIDQVEATALSRIGVLGPGAGEALPRLWARGYARAQAGRRGHPAPQDGELLHDIVLISASRCAASALRSAANVLSGLRTEGRLVVELTALEGRHEIPALKAGLAALGLRPLTAERPDLHLVFAKSGDEKHPAPAATATATR